MISYTNCTKKTNGIGDLKRFLYLSHYMTSQEQEPLYYSDDPVIVLDDSSFVGKNCKIGPDAFVGEGILKAYAPWCPHCQSKVTCLNRLAELLEPHNIFIYVIDVEDNPIFSEHFKNKIKGLPTFLEVLSEGYIGGQFVDKKGEPVYTVPDIVSSLCNHNKSVCKYITEMEQCLHPKS